MKKVYAIIGSGRQGVSAAYDLALNGDAQKIYLIDRDKDTLNSAMEYINSRFGKDMAEAVLSEISDKSIIGKYLSQSDAAVSAVPYYYNLDLSKLAIETKTHFFDFGGNTDVVKSQLSLDLPARKAGVSIVPDCGMDPGMNISLIMYVLSQFDECNSVKSYGAGLVQNPTPPWNFALSFHVNGLTNEYYGKSLGLHDGELAEFNCFSEREFLDFPKPIGKLEAAVTSGGLSTLPISLKGKVHNLINKTLRYPGHWDRFEAFSDLGLFSTEPVEFEDRTIVPRDFYHFLLEPRITVPNLKDIGIIRIIAEGIQNGKRKEIDLLVEDYFDEQTGLTAMQRLTGWHASMAAILAVNGQIERGALPVESAFPGELVYNEMKNRGIKITVCESYPD